LLFSQKSDFFVFLEISENLKPKNNLIRRRNPKIIEENDKEKISYPPEKTQNLARIEISRC
jgi:hypothetical protein